MSELWENLKCVLGCKIGIGLRNCVQFYLFIHLFIIYIALLLSLI